MSEYTMKTNGVCVYCLTYNHNNYIKNTLDSFISQNIDFPYKVIVHDDASTDGTADIVRNYAKTYPNLIVPICQESNQYSKGVNIYKEYIAKHLDYRYTAICEGDDYWTDNNKISKQYYYMENNPDVSLCVHNTIRASEDGTTRKFSDFQIDTDISLETLIKAGPGKLFHTSSFMIRTELLDYPQELAITGIGDYNRAIYAAINGKIHFFSDIMSYYRANANNNWSKRILGNDERRIKHYKDMSIFFENLDTYTSHVYQESCMEKVIYYDKKVILQENTLLEAMFNEEIRHKIKRMEFNDKKYIYLGLLKKTIQNMNFLQKFDNS